MKDIEVLVFDYDGILADSVAAHTEARMQAFADSDFGDIDLSVHAEAHRHGSTPPEIIGWILKHESIVPVDADVFTDKTVRSVVDRKNKIFFANSSAGLDAIPGSIEFVHKAVGKYGVGNLAIATTASYDREVQPFFAAAWSGKSLQ